MISRTENAKTAEVKNFLDELKNLVRHGQDMLRTTGGVVKERACGAAKKTDAVVRENPYYSVGVAFGAGILLGVLVSGYFGGEED